jgi:hypothetical protein
VDENGVDKIAWEVGKAGSRVQKLDVAWTGKGYQFAMDANRRPSTASSTIPIRARSCGR